MRGYHHHAAALAAALIAGSSVGAVDDGPSPGELVSNTLTLRRNLGGYPRKRFKQNARKEAKRNARRRHR